MAFQPLEKLHRLHDGYRKVIRLGRGELLLLQEEGRVHIVSNQCTHMNAPLHNGTVTQGYLRCPLHGLEFSLDSGEPRVSGCMQALQVYRPVYEGNTIGIDVPDGDSGRPY
ncbi:Rieske (2Fe-2S) protein [Pseudomaricurvus sp. HS19]|uniref:Rieske (2Fe-2S) protein n=1 Tax=Pseudomaricurvus sp. HS19 TaxID=2692626 RepID=UPI00136F5E15|nr:Rieske (2Fe-2S) protein [Pseudomaricurvus sp. HS19]MYM62201.1 Rieske 2Fe-2S domain-containing protein [Pseudomaricurvus sp. HS19]